MKVFLLYLANPKYGGWATYTCHLYNGLLAAGYEPRLIKQGNRTEAKLREYGRKVRYQNISKEDLRNLCGQHPVLITAVDKHHHDTAIDLLSLGAAIVIHDPTELKEPIKSVIPSAQTVVIRESMLAHLPHATFIQHPYQSKTVAAKASRKPAVALSRIDFDKHTELIINANMSLETPIDIYGFLNPVYAHFKLEDISENWKDNYLGKFSADDLWAATNIATGYERVVDMSIIKKDGGGTQYTFLEAANAGAHLILHDEWQPKGILRDYAHTCSSSEELASLCTTQLPERTEQAQALLTHHDAKSVASLYAEALGW